MITLNNYRKNIYYAYGLRECPYYGEDGVILKIFDEIRPANNPCCVEFGESRVLGTTTRSFRIKYQAKAIYFTGNYDLKAFFLNIIDIIKVSFLTRKISFFKFFYNMPFKYFVNVDNILQLLKKRLSSKKIDILTIDIDSYDYYIAEKILSEGYSPKLLILEYNPSFGTKRRVTHPTNDSLYKINRRLYGASYAAMNNLADTYGYKLCFVSGFCNLFYIRKDYGTFFEKPDIEDEITDTKDKILNYIKKHCQRGFVPSWLNEPELTEQDFSYLDNL